LSGSVGYAPEPVDAPAPGNLLICCSQPRGELVLTCDPPSAGRRAFCWLPPDSSPAACLAKEPAELGKKAQWAAASAP
jgi:hypothetical protein